MLKLSDITAFIETIRKEGAISGGYSAQRIANDAGIHLYTMHPWRWREGASVTVNLVNDQAYVDLPADLGEITAWGISGRNRSIGWTTPEHLAELREKDALAGHGGYYAAISQPPQANQESELPAWRMELHPKVTVEDESITLWYRREWPFVSDANHVLAIRRHVQPLYMQLVRAFTIGGWTGTQDTTSLMLSEIESGAIFRAAKNADGRIQPHMGPVRNGAIASGGVGVQEFGSGAVTYVG